MSIEGNIDILIHRSGPNIDGANLVEITSSRRTDIANFLVNKTPDEAISILPSIFNICGKAHANAAKIACGRDQREDYLLVLCENAREHLLRIFTGWDCDKKTSLSKTNFSEITGLVSAMERAIEDDHPNVKNIARQIGKYLHQHIFNCSPSKWLELDSDLLLANWAEQTNTIAGRFIDHIYLKELQSVGAINPDFLPEIPAEKLHGKLKQKGAKEFVARPQWAGRCYETGTLARNHAHPLISALAKKYGFGLLVRQVARLIELAKIPAEIECFERASGHADSALGLGQVETARGRLTHCVVVENNIIADYKILAPTEWNFHPDGVASKCLQSLSATDNGTRNVRAKMIIEAIDPCVAYDVRFS